MSPAGVWAEAHAVSGGHADAVLRGLLQAVEEQVVNVGRLLEAGVHLGHLPLLVADLVPR